MVLPQVDTYAQTLLAAANPYKLDCPAFGYPSHWAPQRSNTELFEVHLGSPEIASLVEAMHQLDHVTLLKVK